MASYTEAYPRWRLPANESLAYNIIKVLMYMPQKGLVKFLVY
jgi:hypothetical protein